MSLDRLIGAYTGITNRNIVKFISSHLDKHNITVEQWSVLAVLYENDGLTQKELAQKISKDQPTLTRILDLLEKKELVKRCPKENDRRAYLLHITDKGRDLKEELYPIIEGLFKKILSGISEEHLELYKSILTKINENIKNLE